MGGPHQQVFVLRQPHTLNLVLEDMSHVLIESNVLAKGVRDNLHTINLKGSRSDNVFCHHLALKKCNKFTTRDGFSLLLQIPYY